MFWESIIHPVSASINNNGLTVDFLLPIGASRKNSSHDYSKNKKIIPRIYFSRAIFPIGVFISCSIILRLKKYLSLWKWKE